MKIIQNRQSLNQASLSLSKSPPPSSQASKMLNRKRKKNKELYLNRKRKFLKRSLSQALSNPLQEVAVEEEEGLLPQESRLLKMEMKMKSPQEVKHLLDQEEAEVEAEARQQKQLLAQPDLEEAENKKLKKRKNWLKSKFLNL